VSPLVFCGAACDRDKHRKIADNDDKQAWTFTSMPEAVRLDEFPGPGACVKWRSRPTHLQHFLPDR
jgi:hypothetical protein